MNYDEHGNITGKSDLGLVMEYNDERPHAISGIGGNPSLISDEEQIITYTDFKKVATVTEGNNNLELTYGIGNQRRKGVFKTNDQTTLTRYYLGDYEEEQTPDGQTRKIHYLSGGNGLAAIYVETDGNGQLFYAYTDYLGSLTALTDAGGSVKERQAFDPWGNRRNPSDWTSLITTPVSNITGRGYTMHEHLDGFALINMNGRVYDPQIARFLSPDPQLQAPGYWLNYNRYGYCYNNPMVYKDPDGEWIHIAIGALVGGAVNLAMNWDNIDGFWQGAAAFGVGAGAGAVTAATGGAAGAGFWATAGVASAGSAVTMGTNSVIAQTGQNFSGMNNVDWGQVGLSSAIGGVSGFAGGAAGHWAANSSMLVNGISSPVLRSAVVSPLAAGAGHITGGTTAGLIQGQSFDEAFENSFNGLGQGMALGAAIGVASTVGVSYAKGISPWTGKQLNTTPQDLIDAFEIKGTIDRINRGEKHSHRNDGTTFRNDKGFLPELDFGSYTEYVHPTPGVNHAGMQRIVIGPRGEIYYTPDHYSTFFRIK